jgi:TonB family protein
MPHIPLNLGPLDSKLEISVVVEPDGVVRESVVTVSSGNREIDELYLAAVRSWSYTPALIGGKPVAVQAHQDFKIRLY